MTTNKQWTGKQGPYWIKLDPTQDGRIRASAAGPITNGTWVGDERSAVADTSDDAERLLIAKLVAMGA
jgi:hypothetical protein